MIRVNRHHKDTSGRSIRPSPDWFKQAGIKTRQAIEEIKTTGVHQEDDAVYGHDQVRMALTKLFHDKCAYCESELAESGWDIEHYRPKGRVTGVPSHPGYYWLTYVWDNLLPACPFCNQRRRGAPTWDHPVPTPAAGKYDQFPLVDESKRVSSPRSVNTEEPLLLNPYKDQPETHFMYNVLGEVVGLEHDPRLKATVEICNLQRHALKKKRRMVIERTRAFLETIKFAKNKGNTDTAVELEGILRNFYLDDRCSHAGAARDVTRDPSRFGV